ncbi:MAG: mechanosensitive ion channel [Proteobacteria bacterium]|nr:mechanosensitive ion channel [Pseudomonadota bacterium]
MYARIGWKWLLLCWLLPAGLASAQAGGVADVPAAAPTVATTSAGVDLSTTAADVEVWNRQVATFAVPYNGLSPQDRARNASARLERMLDTMQPDELAAEWAQVGTTQGVMITSHGRIVFGLLPEDVGGGAPASREQVLREGEAVVGRLRQVLLDHSRLDHPMQLLRATGLAVLVSVLALLVVWAAGWLRRRLQGRLQTALDAVIKAGARRLKLGGYEIQPLLYSALQRLAGLFWLLFICAVGYLWLSFVLRQFPYTAPWGETLGAYLVGTASGVLIGLVDATPSLLMLLVIWLVTRGLTHLVRAWFRGVERGTIRVGWLDPAVALMTQRIVSVLLWLFALTLAYPYIPGSHSDVFKGVSVFAGLMLSLGSAGTMNQFISGLFMLYSRAIRLGDYVRICEHEGTVTHIGALSLKLLTPQREQVTVPNSMLVTSLVRNYTRPVDDAGLAASTSVSARVTIGYDTPWRQVEALLQLAAARTPDVLQRPRPQVLQLALSDFYVEYQLTVAIAEPKQRTAILSRLHNEILDAFNEQGLQVMSSHFFVQPKDKVWVPRDKWYAAPAVAPEQPGKPME